MCREMKWTWQEYHEQPAFFIEVLLEMLKAENSAIAKKKKTLN